MKKLVIEIDKDRSILDGDPYGTCSFITLAADGEIILERPIPTGIYEIRHEDLNRLFDAYKELINE